ncbi:isochorismatase family protein [Agaribacter marinus]|uniref:isochorismatase n=1 Tax=Virgibacillus salarius TaxID=447199 RepID=A0A941ICQ0_9BACI|nr:isochorismatase family protein [Virgibacillus salarius]MBR7797612.1 isochorismatase family protein [Virgibacillus salarius]NAZ10321.1 isochorismatase family protein [Agaribacter marinus]
MGLPSITTYPMPQSSDLPNNKVDWKVDPKRAVLLIHDMQQYFINAYDSKQSPLPELVNNIKDLKQRCTQLNIPVFYTAQPGNQAPADRALLQDFWGSGLSESIQETQIIKELTPDESDTVLTKWRYSAFKKSDLLRILQESDKDQIIITGVYAHIGCLVTATDAFMEDIQSFFVADAVADFSEADHQMALQYAATRCGYCLTTEAVLRDLISHQDLNQDDAFSFSDMKIQIANLLDIHPDDIANRDNLLDIGLDSIRMMSLVEEWRQQGIEVNFMKLVERPTLHDWWEMITGIPQNT